MGSWISQVTGERALGGRATSCFFHVAHTHVCHAPPVLLSTLFLQSVRPGGRLRLRKAMGLGTREGGQWVLTSCLGEKGGGMRSEKICSCPLCSLHGRWAGGTREQRVAPLSVSRRHQVCFHMGPVI